MPSFTTKPEFIVVLLAATPILAPPCGSHLAGIGIIKHCIQATESLQFQREHKEASGARKKNKTKSFAPIPSVVHSNDFSRALTRLEKKKKKKKSALAADQTTNDRRFYRKRIFPRLGLAWRWQNSWATEKRLMVKSLLTLRRKKKYVLRLYSKRMAGLRIIDTSVTSANAGQD